MLRLQPTTWNELFDTWNPMERFQREAHRLMAATADDFPSLNVYTTESGAIATALLPGFDANDFDITTKGKTLTIYVKRQRPNLAEGESYRRQERRFGEFRRTVELPFPIEVSRVEAQYARGILEIRLPRAEEDRPRKIVVKSDQ